MTRYTANVTVPDECDLGAFATMVADAGFDVEQVSSAHGLVVQRDAYDEDEFLDALEDEIAPFVDARIDDHGEAA